MSWPILPLALSALPWASTCARPSSKRRIHVTLHSTLDIPGSLPMPNQIESLHVSARSRTRCFGISVPLVLARNCICILVSRSVIPVGRITLGERLS